MADMTYNLRDEIKADLKKAIWGQREQTKKCFAEFLKHLDDLPDRMQREGVSAVLDREDDVFSLAVGPAREALSLSADGELYLRLDPQTSELISAELYNYADNQQQNSLPFRLILDLIQKAGSVTLTVLAPEGQSIGSAGLDKAMREWEAIGV